jgi:hypothetical protein
MDAQPDTSRPVDLGFLPTTYVLIVTLPVLLFGVMPDRVALWTQQAAAGIFG